MTETLVTIDRDQRIYVMVNGFISFEAAEREGRGILAWLSPEQQLPFTAMPGTRIHFDQYQAILAHAEANVAADATCTARLISEFIGLEGKRVEVTLPNGETKRFYIGRSIGWLPCHLELRSRQGERGIPTDYQKGSTFTIIG